MDTDSLFLIFLQIGDLLPADYDFLGHTQQARKEAHMTACKV